MVGRLVWKLRVDTNRNTEKVRREALIGRKRRTTPVTINATCEGVQVHPLVHFVRTDHTEFGDVVIPVGLIVFIAGELAIS